MPAPTKYVEVVVHGPPDASEALSSRLVELGSPGVDFPTSAGDRVRGYLPDDDALGGALDEMGRYLDSLRCLGFAVGGMATRPAPQVDWVRDFQERCLPRRIGPFRIVPEFHREGQRRQRRARTGPLRRGPRGALIEIVLTPGMAFGTGEHPTTRLCLKALADVPDRGPPGRILDIGCGSGILGIAAARRFPQSRVTAVDIDPAAYHVTRENVRVNRVAGRITVREGSLEKARGRFDLVLANLFLKPLREMTPRFEKILTPGGRAVLSGLLNAQAQEYATTLKAAGLTVEKRTRESGWSCVTARKPSD